MATIIGLGGLMTLYTNLKWSGFGFALLITALTYQYYFLINAFWTKADVQATNENINQMNTPLQYYGDVFPIFLSERFGVTGKTFGETATGAFKCAMTITVAFTALIGRAGPLEILILVLFGGALYELNRQILTIEAYDVGGSMTIFMFGGIMGSVAAIMLAVTKQKNHIREHIYFNSSRFGSTLSAFGAAFFWVFYPCIFYDVPAVKAQGIFGPFFESHGFINSYYAIAGAVTTSLAMSALMHGRIRIKDLIYAPFAGAAIVASSAVMIFNPMAAMLLGVIAGILQPIFNNIDDKMSKKTMFSTCTLFVFAIQGFLGSLAAGIMRAILYNSDTHDYSMYPWPFKIEEVGEYYRATFISFGIALGAGVICGAFMICLNGQDSNDFFHDRAYWIVLDDGLRPPKGEVSDGDEIKGVHAYL